MLANNEREHPTYDATERAQTRDERPDKRHGMLTIKEGEHET